MNASILVTEISDASGYTGTAIDLPGIITQGETIKELKQNMREAIRLYLESVKQVKDLPKIKAVEIVV